MSTVGRRIRLVAGLVVLGLLLVGTFWGDDDHFPFGPFRMYSTANDPEGQVNVLVMRATTADGRTFEVGAGRFGLRRQEINARVGVIMRDPRVLGEMAESYERLNPDAPPLAKLQVLYELYRLRGGKPVDRREELLAVWSRG